MLACVNGSAYYFVKNLQGDMTGILDSNGNTVGTYEYEAYGVITAIKNAQGYNIMYGGNYETSVLQLNPFRYRGYMFDSESDFYYLNSRYYDPWTSRFLNADNTDVVTASMDKAEWDKNLFAYCDNNPINRFDDSGEFWKELQEFGKSCVEAAIVVAAVAGSITAVGGAIALTVGTGGAGAIAIPAAVSVAVEALAVAATATAAIGATSVAVGKVGENISYSKNASRYNQSKSKDNKTPNGNKRQNKQFSDATKGLSKEQKRMVHDRITKKGYDYHDIKRIAQRIKRR